MIQDSNTDKEHGGMKKAPTTNQEPKSCRTLHDFKPATGGNKLLLGVAKLRQVSNHKTQEKTLAKSPSLSQEKKMAFKALSYTAPRATGVVAPLYREDQSIATNKQEQNESLFFGTSVTLTECNTEDVAMILAPPKGVFPYPSVK